MRSWMRRFRKSSFWPRKKMEWSSLKPRRDLKPRNLNLMELNIWSWNLTELKSLQLRRACFQGFCSCANGTDYSFWSAMASEEEEEETSRESPSSLNEAMLEQIKKMMIEEFDRREKIKEGKRKQPKDPVTSKKKPIEDLSGYMMIPPFHGNNDPDVYLDWERKCEIIFNRHNIADINRVTLAAMEFKVMRQRFAPNHYQREPHSKIRKHSEGTRSVEEYYSSHGKTKPKQPDKITKPYPRHFSKETSPEPQESIQSKGKHSVSQQLQELTFCRTRNRDHDAMAAGSVKEVPKDHAEKGLGAKDVSVQTPCYQLQGNKKQEIVSVSNNGKVQAKLFQTVYDDSMTGMMHLSFSKGVETGTGSSEEQMEKANQEKETQPNLDPPESKPPDQQLQDHEFNPEGPEPNNKRKSKSEQEYSQAMPTSKLSEFLNQHIHPVFLTVLMHLSWFKEVEKGTAEQERRLEAHKALTCHTKKEYEQHVLKSIAAADSLMSVLNSTQDQVLWRSIKNWKKQHQRTTQSHLTFISFPVHLWSTSFEDKTFSRGRDDAIMDEEVQEKQLLAEEEDGMEQLEAEEGLEAAQLEPDGAKHMELEPDGIKELAAEKELVSKDSVAAPMELITHSGVNLEPRWRRHDPKPPWFLIQAQEISKWACVSFVLFFPCQVLSQWVFLTRFLMRQMGHIQITHLADQDQGPSILTWP
ncbi:unnamed protein product [Microthlaspi erraticum]|uniref:Retrotransposon gag domain-containing protein n=1 Tax=Microthlaspi erraticum TaxID=1685480 RepID=A0A6D2JHY7_9BRAS|nr:unnamed protein product [Microthlaspi erraticum]